MSFLLWPGHTPSLSPQHHHVLLDSKSHWGTEIGIPWHRQIMPGSVAAAVELSDQNLQNITRKQVNDEEHGITVPLISVWYFEQLLDRRVAQYLPLPTSNHSLIQASWDKTALLPGPPTKHHQQPSQHQEKQHPVQAPTQPSISSCWILSMAKAHWRYSKFIKQWFVLLNGGQHSLWCGVEWLKDN